MSAKYKTNLLIGFGLSLVILLISSAASYISIQNLLFSADRVNHTNEVIINIEVVRSALKDAESGQRGYLLTNDERFLEHYQLAQERTYEALDKVAVLTADNQAQQDTVEQLRMAIKSRVDMLKEVITVKETTGVLSIEALDRGRDYMNAARDLMTKVKDREQELLVLRTGRMNTFITYTPFVIIISALIALIITTLFYIRIKNDFGHRQKLQEELLQKDRDITERIHIIQEIAAQISRGDYQVRISGQQSDALGGVADSLNKMAGSLQQSFNLLSDKEWLQTGIAKLNDVMIGEDSVSTLSKNIIQFISGYINSHASALYVVERENLKLYASYAYVADASRESFKLGEGLIGQAVANRSVMQIKDIPAQNIYIKFTTGEANPRHVVAIPIYDGRIVKGGIEVASLHAFTERELDLLTACSHNIGIAISTAQNRKKLQELLEETQSQAEELQTQHRELENMNSELELQAEKLQVSEEELRVQQEELRQANQELEERSRLLEDRNELILERNSEIQAKAEQLAQSTRYKSEFLANMSHELRTPLNSILLLSRLMSENGDENLTSDQVEFARVIETSGKGLLSLIDEILDLSKIESGKMELDFKPVSVVEVVDDMRSLFGPVAQDKKLEFRTHIAEDVPKFIETDRMRLEQIIRNLISNALKFTATGYVSMSVRRDAKDAFFFCISVKDTGIGIAREKQELIFEAFQQADGSTQRKYGGTGLGLSISRELAKLLGGDIYLSSELGQGSEFIIRLPLHKQPGVQLLATKETVLNDLAKILDQTTDTGAERKYISSVIPENIPDDRDNINANDKLILIVEDDTNFARSLLEYTRKQGYKGIVTVRGDEALPLAKAFSPLGILLDIQLPIKNGWEVMEELKTDSSTRHIPVHIMSSLEVKNESLRKGAVDFMEKPIAFERMKEIFDKIEYVLTHHPKKVLIVEENPKHAEALAHFLKTFDVKLEVKNDVEQAITSLKNEDVHCVVLDMGIPDQRSYDTLEEVKKTPGLETLPVIVFTGKSLSPAEEVRIKQYADSIVVKTAHSYQRILDEVSLFLHLMEKNDASDKPRTRPNRLSLVEDVLKGKTVLVADDDVRNIFSLTKALESVKANVIAAVDGKDALKQLQNNPQIDVVLMDMMMPEMDGYESTAAIRKDPRFKNIPIISVTAKAMMGDREKCIRAGASDYITKPVDIDQLLSLLRVWLYERG